jgi:hypothetical protein
LKQSRPWLWHNMTSNSLDKISTFYFDQTWYNRDHVVLIISL